MGKYNAAGLGLSTPTCICFDGTHIWVTNSGNNSVTEFKVSDGSLVGNYLTGYSSPVGICFDGINIWVTNYSSGKVSKY
jgi:DNA-binding beta-propeller fold protein YncE